MSAKPARCNGMSEQNEPIGTGSDTEQEPPVTTPPDPESVPGGPTAPADGQTDKSRDGGEDVEDDSHRSTAYSQAKAE